MLSNILFKSKLITCLMKIVPTRHDARITPMPEGDA